MEIRCLKNLEVFSNEKLQKINLFETATMFTDIYCLEPGQEQRAHSHADADKVYFVLEGTPEVLVGNELSEVESGSAVLAPAGIEHGVRNASATRCVLLVFMAPNPNRR
ncbi:MAG: cupin domain-containing protein [Acidobacteria bacterium]|nr:cupin domain-containing protein [Acidobacteriota bacterium]